MGRAEAQTFAPSPGSGRLIDCYWPSVFGVNAPLLTFTYNRWGSGASQPMTTAVTGSAATVALCGSGLDLVAQQCNLAGDSNAIYFTGTMNVHLRTSIGHGIGAMNEMANVYRYIVAMSGPGSVPANPLDDHAHDFGMSVARAVSTRGMVLADATDGWHLQFVDTNVVRLYVRGPNGLVAQAMTAAPFNATVLHTYEMRFTSATATVPAQFAVLIDNVNMPLPALTASWAAGTNNPASALTGGWTGFRPMLVNKAGVATTSTYIVGVRLIAAPTLADALT